MAKSRIRKFRESFLYAGRGLRLCITGERNFRVHMTAAFYVTAAAVMGHVTSTEAAVLCLSFGLSFFELTSEIIQSNQNNNQNDSNDQ